MVVRQAEQSANHEQILEWSHKEAGDAGFDIRMQLFTYIYIYVLTVAV